MGKSKKKRKDFQKIKLKVGKKLKKADNVTNASFQTRTIQITQQLKTDRSQPSTSRKLNIQDLLSQCQHYSITVRHDAVTGLRELLTSHPELMTSNLATILERTSELFTDKDPVVRKAVIKFLKLFYSSISQKQLSPFFPLLRAHLCCAMTHIYDDIKADSLNILDLLLEFYPDMVIHKSSQLFSNFIEQISKQQGEKGKSSRTLVSNPNSKMSTLKWRSSVLDRLQKFLSEILSTHGNKGQISSKCDSVKESKVVWSGLDVAAIQPFPQMFSQMWNNSTFTIRTQLKESTDIGRVGTGAETTDLIGFTHTLIPLLLQCWIEASTSNTQQSSQVTGSLLRSNSADLVSSVLAVTQLLLDCIHINTDQNNMRWLSEKYLKDFKQYFLAKFPYSLLASLTEKSKHSKSSQVTAESINLLICDIMTNFLPIVSNQHLDEVPSWLGAVIRYLTDFLKGHYNPHCVGQNAQLVSKIVTRLIITDRRCNTGEYEELVTAVFQRFRGAHPMSMEKRVYLKLFADLTSTEDFSDLMTMEREETYFANLPELLPLVSQNQQMSAMLLEVMKKRACQHCRILLSALHRNFQNLFGDTVAGRLALMEQKELVGLLYYMPDLTEDCYKILVKFSRSLVIPQEIVLYMIHVVQNRFVQVTDMERAGSEPEKMGRYISFLVTLLLGVSCQDIENYAVSQIQDPCGIDGLHVQKEHLETDIWTRHQSVIEAVMQSFQQCPEQMLHIAETFLKNILEGIHTLPILTAYGVLYFIARSDHLKTTSREFKGHFVKLCIATMHSIMSADSPANEIVSLILDSVLELSQDVLMILNGGLQRICEVLMTTAKDEMEEDKLCVLAKIATSLLQDEGRRGMLQGTKCTVLLSQLHTKIEACLSDGTQRQWFAEFQYFLSLLSQ